jgi:hypothetical protein
MKTIASLCTLSACVFLTGTDSAEAQQILSRKSYRVGVSQPTRIVGRHAVSRPVVTYGGFSHIDDLAIELEQRARDILWEMHFHYRHNRDFDVTYVEAYSMLTQAKHLHAAEHRGDRSAIARIAQELDELFHHVEDDVRTWRPSRRHFVGHGLGGHGVGHGLGHGFGHGGALPEKTEAMELTLHHLMQDVGLDGATTDPPAPGGFGNPPVPRLRLP